MYEIIVNPKSQSGKGIENWKKTEKLLKEYGAQYRVHFSHSDEDVSPAVALYEEYKAKKEILHLVILGGDGTVNDILQILPELENVRLSVIPSGSGNDLCRSLGVKGSIKKIVSHLLNNPVTELMDVGVVHTENSTLSGYDILERRFIVSVGIGYDASICEEVEISSMKAVLNKLGLGKLVYLFVALKQLFEIKEFNAELTIDNETKAIPLNKFVLVTGMNNKYEGGGFMFGGTETCNKDGLLDICAVSGITKFQVLKMIPQAAKGRHFKNEGVNHYRAKNYTVKTSKPMWVHTDGEVRLRADYIAVSVNKEAINIVY